MFKRNVTHKDEDYGAFKMKRVEFSKPLKGLLLVCPFETLPPFLRHSRLETITLSYLQLFGNSLSRVTDCIKISYDRT
jgi:hypothetical protein